MATRNRTTTRPPAGGKSDKATLFHSEFIRLCESGPVEITVVKEAQQSKFPGKPPYATILIEGRERQYWCDNESIEQFFAGQAGRSFSVIAEGGKGEEVLTYVGEVASPQERRRETPPRARRETQAPPPARETQRPPANPPRGETAARQSKPADKSDTPEAREERYKVAIAEVKVAAGREMVLAAIASDAAEIVAERHMKKHGKPMSEERIQGIAMRMMISLSSRAGTLPSGHMEKYLPFEPKALPSDNDGTQ